MERILQHPLLHVTPEQYKAIRKNVGLEDDEKLLEYIEAIEEWAKKQDHLAEAFKYFDRDVLERMIVISKVSTVEGMKSKIERIFTIRGLTPEICANRTAEEYKKISENIMFIPLPMLCPTDLSRVHVVQSSNGGWEDFSFTSLIRSMFLIGEYRAHFDYCIGERFIFDLQGVTIGFVSKLNPLILKKAEILSVEGYELRIKGIHFVNAPTFIDKIIAVIKPALKEKVASRIHVHKTYEDLHEHIPKKILPIEYGGEEMNSKDLNKKWIECLKTEEAIRLIENSNKLLADESKRSEIKFNEEYLGMPGSFRRLKTD